MYKEATGIIEAYQKVNLFDGTATNEEGKSDNNFDLEVNIEKWWWFTTIFTSTTGRFLLQSNNFQHSMLSFLNNKDVVNLICFGMVALGLVMAVVGMASHVDASADKFRSYLGEVASSHFALVSVSP